jgi:hypothetical protein
MIEIHPLREKDKLAKLYVESNVKMNENSMAVVCADGEDVLGFCLFDMLADSLVVHSLEPQNNLMLLDGILRSALHVGVENGIMSAFYSENAPKDVFSKLKFIKNEENRELNVDKLFSSCKNCDIQ